MAGHNGDKEPLLSKISVSNKKRRYRRCRSSPALVSAPFKESRLGSITGKLQIHPSLMLVSTLLAVYIGSFAVCFYFFWNQIQGHKTIGIVDSIYFCIVTMSTVGYGDLVPHSIPTKLLACAFVFLGMALYGLILTKSADYLVQKQEMLVVKALHRLHGTEKSEAIRGVGVRQKCLLVLAILLVLVIVGTVFLFVVEKMDIVDAFYCVCCTITTLGYGDRSFSTEGGRVFGIFWILTSSVCLVLFFLYLAEVNTESRQREVVNWVLTRKTTNLDLEAADLDDNGVVSVAEFIIYKMREMGKITQEDISAVMDEFEELDVDQSGTLSASDITLSHC